MAASSASDMATKRGSKALILATVLQSGLTLRSLAEPKSDLASEPSMKSSTSGRNVGLKDRQIRMAAARET
jgi:hypothetical protein